PFLRPVWLPYRRHSSRRQRILKFLQSLLRSSFLSNRSSIFRPTSGLRRFHSDSGLFRKNPANSHEQHAVSHTLFLLPSKLLDGSPRHAWWKHTWNNLVPRHRRTVLLVAASVDSDRSAATAGSSFGRRHNFRCNFSGGGGNSIAGQFNLL